MGIYYSYEMVYRGKSLLTKSPLTLQVEPGHYVLMKTIGEGTFGKAAAKGETCNKCNDYNSNEMPKRSL